MSITIEQKIQKYIQRLYQFKALENFVVFLLFFTGYFLLYLLVESIFYLPSSYRTFLFYFAIFTSVFWILHKILYPLTQSFVPNLQISYVDASKNIGKINSDIDDKLLNLLQLKEYGSGDLINESIKQLEINLFKFDFIKTLNLNSLKFFIKLLLLPVVFFLIFSVINFDGFISNPSKRILSYTQKFEKPLDFKVKILNDDLTIVEGEDFKLKYSIFSSNNTPLFLFIDNDVFEVDDVSSTNIHNFINVKSNLEFKIGESKTKAYTFNLKLIYPPKINSLILQVIPPKYTHLPSKEISNISDVSVAEGSVLKWMIESNNVSRIIFKTDSSNVDFNVVQNLYSLPRVVYKSFNYSILISSSQLQDYVTLDYSITTLYDAHPKLNVDIFKAKHPVLGINSFILSASDDYGISKYGYQVLRNGNILKSKYINFSSKKLSNNIFDVDTRNMDLSGDAFIRFFVSDNDKINGSKTSFSSKFSIHIFTTNELTLENSIQKDSLFNDFSTKLQNKIKLDSLNNNSINFQENKQSEQEKLQQLKYDLEKSLIDKQQLLQNLNSINDQEMLKEIEDAIKAQKELLKEINDALKDNTALDNSSKKSEELKNKNDFQQKKTLNLLRKIASSQLLKSLTKDAKELDNSISKLSDNPLPSETTSIKEQLSKLEEKLEKYSKLKGSDDLKKELQKDIDQLANESSKTDSANKERMKSSSENIHSKLKSKSSMSGGGGESMTVDLELLNFLLNNYLSSSYDEELLIKYYDISSLVDHNNQYNILSRLSFLNSSLYNFAIENKYFTRASFDLIYPLQQYQDNFNDTYESSNSFKLNQVQREMLSDVNSVTDMLSDIIEQMNNADMNSSGQGKDGNEREGSTPQDLIDQQQKLNSQSKGTQEGKGKQGKGENQLSDEEISDIIKKQEEIRNKYNELNGGSNNKMDKAVKKLKKALLKQNNSAEIKHHQNTILKFLKDFNGESKEKEKKRKSKVGTSTHNKNTFYDLIPDSNLPIKEDLRRDNLDYNEFYNNKINKKIHKEK